MARCKSSCSATSSGLSVEIVAEVVAATLSKCWRSPIGIGRSLRAISRTSDCAVASKP